MFAQTVTDIYPTRVTSQTKITIFGTGFNNTIKNSISINDISITDVTLVSSSQISLKVSKTGTSNTSNRAISISGVTFDSGVDTTIDYIGYKDKSSSASSGSEYFDKITEIFTNWDYNGNGYWRSNWYSSSNQNTWPNDRQELLAFTYNGVTYSTGVDDDLLTAKGISFQAQTFRAYSTNGIVGKTTSSNFIEVGDLVDGIVGEGTSINSKIADLKIFEMITDGKNGLDLGTGVTNFNSDVSIEFNSPDGEPNAIGDIVPDLIITQIAAAGGYDIYYYQDERGNVVGTPIRLYIDQTTNNLAEWRMDLFSVTNNVSYEDAVPTGRGQTSNETRPLKLFALHFDDFDITTSNIDDVYKINLAAGGTADLAFLAYNASAFVSRAPVVDSYIESRYLCRLPATSDIVLKVNASIGGTATGDPIEDLSYQWYKDDVAISGATTDTYTLSNADSEDLGVYKLEISNGYGTENAVITVAEGGVPTYWDGTSWNYDQDYIDFNIAVNDEDRSLIFSEDYNESVDLFGCDCTVKAGKNVVIPSGKTLMLYNEITVEDATTLDDGNTVSKGTFTLENNASLVQINEENGNINSGDINVVRMAENLHAYDYVYWSSPVANFDINNIENSRAYKWDPTQTNTTGSTGNWIKVVNEAMRVGAGYIARVPESITGASGANSYTAIFTGVPNNTTISTSVRMSANPLPEDEGDRHQNFLGNPYPSAISAIKFLTENSNLEGNVSLWMHDVEISEGLGAGYYEESTYNYGDQFVNYNALGSSIPNAFNGYIASGQGFFVQLLDSASDGGTVTYSNDLRFDSTEAAYNNSEFFRTTTEEDSTLSLEKELIWLNLTNENNLSTSALIGYADGATLGKDRLYDTYANDEDFKIYSLINDDKMVIQGRPLPFSNLDEVPLGINVSDQTTYKIGINNLQGTIFEEGQDIYLKDTYLNVEHNLRDSPYRFTAVSGVTNDRFILAYTASSALSVNDSASNNTFVYINDGVLNVKTFKTISAVKVYDVSGKLLINYKSSNQSSELSTQFNFSKGIYLTSIVLEDGVVVTKKVIN
ncbi:T9SS type A sorting domain-containing protein [Formosa sediminum]|uniref:T9SS type A sorting domain-containing protein n=1 Tax=Formosa sediminum TaxID=2594004 RepID=A0A516GNN1_9FLAO|nr:T9SS type A sorting domain-containing protein [Formosa sediminum]QDO93109.1 T9SS type A sorting domain-containing protein [Formosa sediminum]